MTIQLWNNRGSNNRSVEYLSRLVSCTVLHLAALLYFRKTPSKQLTRSLGRLEAEALASLFLYYLLEQRLRILCAIDKPLNALMLNTPYTNTVGEA